MNRAQDCGREANPPEVALSWRRIPMIFMYHVLIETDTDPNLVCVTPRRFSKQMEWLAARELRGVAISTLLAAVQTSQEKGLVGITFDDGYRTVLEVALPVLQRHGFSATAFVLSDPDQASNSWDPGPQWPLLSASEIAELSDAGVEIGSHGARHVRLDGAHSSELVSEVQGSKDTLEALTGRPIRGFAYPWGAMDSAARQAVIDAGYEYACVVGTRRAMLGTMALPRIYIGERDNGLRLAGKRRLCRANHLLQGIGR